MGLADAYLWLAGDHHVHTHYSFDGQYRVLDQVSQASRYGLDWLVITDHGSLAHARLGVRKVNPDIRRARAAHPRILVFQGVEWNVPAAEHATVMVAPSPDEVAVLTEFTTTYDGLVTGTGPGSSANEALAVAGLAFLARAVRSGRLADALMLANHPARNGIDAPHEIRNWRDTAPDIAVGMECAPGHQAAGIPAPRGAGGRRGEYHCSPSPDSFAGYPPDCYRTFGGFDWMTTTVGGFWDSLLAEGRPWWITANSDCHRVYEDCTKNAVGKVAGAAWDTDGRTFDVFGRYGDPVDAGGPQLGYTDFWPGYYTRTHVGTTSRAYRAVMAGIRAGRIWVSHGDLIRGLAVRVRCGDDCGVTLGGRLAVAVGATVGVEITLTLAGTPNFGGQVPTLARVDMITGPVTGTPADRDVFTAPGARLTRSWEVGRNAGTVMLSHTFRDVRAPFYLRLRGTDGNRVGPGPYGVVVDPCGPVIDVAGDADPWADLWFYSNPVWVLSAEPGR
jgi:hypothetical protein